MCEELPANFGDDLADKPATQRQWRWDQQHGMWGYIDPTDTKSWLRNLDYYAKLQQMADESLGTVLSALEASGAYDDTIIIFTSDHGDMCGSHGLRSKGPFVYEEIMHVPCYVRVPGITTAGRSRARSRPMSILLPRSARSEASTRRHNRRCGASTFRPSSGNPPRRSATTCCSRTTPRTRHDQRHVLRNPWFLRRTNEVPRYYGVGGGKPSTGLWGKDPGHKMYDVDAAFEDQEHEWYDLSEDPHELVNLAHDRGRRARAQENYERLLEYERQEMSP